MDLIIIALVVAALLLFLFKATGNDPRFDSVAAGLACLTLAYLLTYVR